MSKFNKRLIEPFIIIIIIGIVLISFVNFKGVQVKFYNNTGKDIDSLIIGETLIGNLKKGDTTDFIKFKKFRFDSGFPYEDLSGTVNGNRIHDLKWSWCASERSYESDGEYIFDIITKEDNEGNTYLHLVKHQ
ncbi:hypothetical protein [Flavobacterium notoginsengisoli]|uniref:hypothetical protein n=1 Tax=Flavobacterium notoginsengisoli TaxID=1478199 RepID=UPI00363CDD42